MSEKTFFGFLVIGLIEAGAIWYLRSSAANAEQQARIVVVDFGQAMQSVSVMASTDVAAGEIAQEYGPYVDPKLLAVWEENPAIAPGRVTSSPWPDHIMVNSVTDDGLGGFHVQGSVIELTSQDIAAGTQTAADPVVVTVSKVNGKWLISAWQGLAG